MTKKKQNNVLSDDAAIVLPEPVVEQIDVQLGGRLVSGQGHLSAAHWLSGAAMGRNETIVCDKSSYMHGVQAELILHEPAAMSV
jgi:hypothetical protein